MSRRDLLAPHRALQLTRALTTHLLRSSFAWTWTPLRVGRRAAHDARVLTADEVREAATVLTLMNCDTAPG